MNQLILIHLLHIFIFGSLFLYVGIQNQKIPTWLYSVLFYLGFIILFYHGYKTYALLKAGKNPWINLFHIFIIAPLLIYIGANGIKTPMYVYQFVLMLAFTVIGYHGYYLLLRGT